MNPLSLAASTHSDVWDVLDRLLDDLARLAKGSGSQDAFDHELLRRSVEALSALGAAFWDHREKDFVRRAVFIAPGAPSTSVAVLHESADAAHRRILQAAVQRGEPYDVAPRSIIDPSVGLTSPYDSVILLAPVVVDGVAIGVLEIVHRAEIAPDAREGALRVLAALADLAADFHRFRQRRIWQERAANAEQMDRLVSALYDELDPAAVAYTAANEGRRWSECDRVSVVLSDGTTARTFAVSGVDLVDRRSDQVRLLERLVAAVVHDGEELWHTDGTERPVVPSVAQALSDYVDHVDSVSVVVLPLFDQEADLSAPPPTDRPVDAKRLPFAALVFERFASSAVADDASRDRLGILARHSRRALLRSLECDSIPLGRWWRRQYRRRDRHARRLVRVGWIAAVATLVLAIPFLIPAESIVESRGRLEPQRRRDVFAPTDGVVAEVAVRHGQTVHADDVLIVMRKPELTVELTRVGGELQVAERRWTALRASRTFENPADASAQIRAQERTAEEEQLKESIRSLTDQQRLLLDQVRDLEVRAPLAGTVTTWDVEQVLAGRPVARGQSLLGIADGDGPWQIELLVPERYVGDVTAARSSNQEPLDVEFVLATNPGTVYRGQVVRVAEAAETDSDGAIVVKTTVAIDRAALDEQLLRPGAVVTARIQCGDSSLGSVWTRDLRRFLRSWWW